MFEFFKKVDQTLGLSPEKQREEMIKETIEEISEDGNLGVDAQEVLDSVKEINADKEAVSQVEEHIPEVSKRRNYKGAFAELLWDQLIVAGVFLLAKGDKFKGGKFREIAPFLISMGVEKSQIIQKLTPEKIRILIKEVADEQLKKSGEKFKNRNE